MAEQVLIIGPGRMGLAIGTALTSVGAVERLIYVGRDPEPPPHPLFSRDEDRAEYLIAPQPVPEGIGIVILAVPDPKIPTVAQGLAQMGPAPGGTVVFHLAGSLSTDPLEPLHAVGYAVGSLHPLQTIADPWTGGDRLIGAAYALGGEPAALAAGRRLVSALGGRSLVIPARRRVDFHAAAVFASDYLIGLAVIAMGILLGAGADEEDALPAILTLMRGTIDNLEDLGLASSLTGPIPRGAADIVRAHLTQLSDSERILYRALGGEVLQLALAAGLDERRAAELESLLELE